MEYYTTELLVNASRALFNLDQYKNLIISMGRCADEDCTKSLVEIYRTDPDGEIEPFLVAAGEGPTLFDAVINAEVMFTTVLTEYEHRVSEIANLEELFKLPTADEPT